MNYKHIYLGDYNYTVLDYNSNKQICWIEAIELDNKNILVMCEVNNIYYGTNSNDSDFADIIRNFSNRFHISINNFIWFEKQKQTNKIYRYETKILPEYRYGFNVIRFDSNIDEYRKFLNLSQL